MKVKLILHDWAEQGTVSIYSTDTGHAVSSGVLHSGSTFDAELTLAPDIESEIVDAYRRHGAYPVFAVRPVTEEG